ncbi:MAG: glycosyltransferase [Rikenellaceae bacterium]|nr:glycosyltransferase [Rikenellaceae bacterium]
METTHTPAPEPARPLFSIVTVVYNSADSIATTLRSVTGQRHTGFDIEYIVIDGGSTDGTLAAVGRHRDRIALVVSEPDRGIYDAMNKGIAAARGRWINFMNSGDSFAGDDVLEQVAAVVRDTDADIVYGDIVELRNGGRDEFLKKAEAVPASKHRMFFCHQAAFVRTELMQALPFDARYAMSADLKFFKLCHRDGRRFRYLNFPVARFDKTGISSMQRARGLRENVRVVCEVDRGLPRIKHAVKLWFVILNLRLRKALKRPKP